MENTATAGMAERRQLGYDAVTLLVSLAHLKHPHNWSRRFKIWSILSLTPHILRGILSKSVYILYSIYCIRPHSYFYTSTFTIGWCDPFRHQWGWFTEYHRFVAFVSFNDDAYGRTCYQKSLSCQGIPFIRLFGHISHGSIADNRIVCGGRKEDYIQVRFIHNVIKSDLY